MNKLKLLAVVSSSAILLGSFIVTAFSYFYWTNLDMNKPSEFIPGTLFILMLVSFFAVFDGVFVIPISYFLENESALNQLLNENCDNPPCGLDTFLPSLAEYFNNLTSYAALSLLYSYAMITLLTIKFDFWNVFTSGDFGAVFLTSALIVATTITVAFLLVFGLAFLVVLKKAARGG